MLRAAPALVLLALATYALLPARLGGRAMFVVVQGNSMEPTYHSGDLVYSWTQASFHAGDVAIYRMPANEPGAGRLIVHRLLRQLPGEPGRWEVKGENRQTPDDTHPPTADLVARPIVNLGPFVTRLMLLVPLLLTACAGWWVGWSLWPRLRREFVWTLPAAPGEDFSWWVDEDLTYGPPRPSSATLSVIDDTARRFPPPMVGARASGEVAA